MPATSISAGGGSPAPRHRGTTRTASPMATTSSRLATEFLVLRASVVISGGQCPGMHRGSASPAADTADGHGTRRPDASAATSPSRCSGAGDRAAGGVAATSWGRGDGAVLVRPHGYVRWQARHRGADIILRSDRRRSASRPTPAVGLACWKVRNSDVIRRPRWGRTATRTTRNTARGRASCSPDYARGDTQRSPKAEVPTSLGGTAR